MSLINTSVPNLIQGVSQQPDATRFDGQCEEQENALSSVADGLRKRPATQHIAKLLDTAISENSFIHFINRDDEEKYVVIHTGGAIEAWNIVSGGKCLINGSGSPFTPPAYLETENPKESLKALTVGDNTFIVNNEVSAALSQTKTPALEKKGFVYIAQGDYKKKYQVDVGGNISGDTASTLATFSVTVEDFYAGRGYERFRISDVSKVNAGAGYPAGTPTDLKITFSWGTLGVAKKTWDKIYTQPEVRVTFVDDGTVDANGVSNGTKKVDTVTVVNQGSFGQHVTQRSGGSFTTSYGAQINLTVQGDAVTGTASSFSTVSLLSTNSEQSDTTKIANSLFDGSFSSKFTSSPLVSTGGTGNIFTTGSDVTTPPLSASHKGNTIIIEQVAAGGDFNLVTEDGLAGNGIKAVYKRIDALSDLPIKAPNNFVVEIVGDADLDQDNYWVKFTTNTGVDFGEGAWEETVAPDVSDGLDASTLPMTIRSTNLNTLEIDTLSFGKRNAGDEDTNPNPSFVGKSINDIVFFKNRLGFITDETVVFSEAGEFFNFFRTTVSSLLDSAPIDITVSSTKVTKLKSATIFQESLMLFADNVQFVMKGGDLFTPKTVSVTPTTNFSLDGSVSPIPLGSYIYFPFNRGNFTGLRELSLSANTETYDAVEVTEHVPSYIPSNIIAMAGTTSEDVIALLSGNQKECLYIYNYFWNNNQKVLSAWSKFSFTGEIRGMEFIDSALYMIIAHHGQTQLLAMPVESRPTGIVKGAYVTPTTTTSTTYTNNPTIVDDTTSGDGDEEPDIIGLDPDAEVGDTTDDTLAGDSNSTTHYKLSTDKSTVVEGNSVTITLNTETLPTPLADGTTVPYTISGTNVIPADLGLNLLTDFNGDFTVTNNTATVTFDIASDQNINEGDEVFTLSLDNGENSISITIVNANGYTVTIFEDEWSSVYFNPTTYQTVAVDSYGNIVGQARRYIYMSKYLFKSFYETAFRDGKYINVVRADNPFLDAFDTTEIYGVAGYPQGFLNQSVRNGSFTGFNAVYSTQKSLETVSSSSFSNTPVATRLLRSAEVSVNIGLGGVASIAHTTTIEFDTLQITGTWRMSLRGLVDGGNYQTSYYEIDSTTTSLVLPPPANACDRIHFELIGGVGGAAGLGSLKITGMKIKLTRPLTAAESAALYGATPVNP
jgi:hypothetical protein